MGYWHPLLQLPVYQDLFRLPAEDLIRIAKVMAPCISWSTNPWARVTEFRRITHKAK